MSQKSNPRIANDLPCPCGSKINYSKCCQPYLKFFGISSVYLKEEAIFFEWLDIYSEPISKTFKEKTNSYIFRISCYLDWIMHYYFKADFLVKGLTVEIINEKIFNVKMNMLHTLLASLTCLSQGLYLQSGILLRSFTEDCLVLTDLFYNEGQITKFLNGKYSTTSLLTRTKKFTPNCVITWYTQLSSNFTHFGPLHPSPYMPRPCWAENVPLVLGIQNIIRAVVSMHITLERIHYNHIKKAAFWKKDNSKDELLFDENSPIFTRTENLGKTYYQNTLPMRRSQDSFMIKKHII